MLEKTKKDGIGVIDKAIGKFQGIVDDLNTGISLCETKVAKNDVSIKKLTDQNDELTTKSHQAEIFRDNLKNMLEKAPDEKNKKENGKESDN